MRAPPTDAPPSHFSWRAYAVVVAAVLAHMPLLSVHLGHLWKRPHYRFAPILVVVVGWLLWTRWPRGAQTGYVRGLLLERVLLGSSLLLLSAATRLYSPALACASAVLCVGFLIVHTAGLKSVPRLIGPWALLWLTIPPPLGYDLWLISKMQTVTSRLSTWMLDAVGVDHWMAGNVLHVSDATFFVDEACSGIHSLFALFAYTAVFVVVASRRVRRAASLLASTFVWAILLNVLRVTAVALAHVWWSVDLATGWAHEALGLLTFVSALALTLSTDQALHALGYVLTMLINALRRTVRADRQQDYRRRQSRSRRQPSGDAAADRGPSRRPSVLTARIAGAAYTLLLFTGVTTLWADDSATASPAPAGELIPGLMPAELDGLQQVHFEYVERDLSSDLGESSSVWTYASEQLRAVVSVDSPFHGWHELCRCYEGRGWTLQERAVGPGDGSSVPANVVEATFSNPLGEHAFLIFSLVDRAGAPIAPPNDLSVKRFLDRVRSQETVQIQTFVVADNPLTQTEREQVRNVFGFALERLQHTIR